MVMEDVRRRLLDRADLVSNVEEKEYALEVLKEDLLKRIPSFTQLEGLFTSLIQLRRENLESKRKTTLASTSLNNTMIIHNRADNSFCSKNHTLNLHTSGYQNIEEEDNPVLDRAIRSIDTQIEEYLSTLILPTEDSDAAFKLLAEYIDLQSSLRNLDNRLHKNIINVENNLQSSKKQIDRSTAQARLSLQDAKERLLDLVDEEEEIIQAYEAIMANRPDVSKILRAKYPKKYALLDRCKSELAPLEAQIAQKDSKRSAIVKKLQKLEEKQRLVKFWKEHSVQQEEIDLLLEKQEKLQIQKLELDNRIIKLNFLKSDETVKGIGKSSNRASRSKSKAATQQVSTGSAISARNESLRISSLMSPQGNLAKFSDFMSPPKQIKEIIFGKQISRNPSIDIVHSNSSNARLFKQKKEYLKEMADKEKNNMVEIERVQGTPDIPVEMHRPNQTSIHFYKRSESKESFNNIIPSNTMIHNMPGNPGSKSASNFMIPKNSNYYSTIEKDHSQNLSKARAVTITELTSLKSPPPKQPHHPQKTASNFFSQAFSKVQSNIQFTPYKPQGTAQTSHTEMKSESNTARTVKHQSTADGGKTRRRTENNPSIQIDNFFNISKMKPPRPDAIFTLRTPGLPPRPSPLSTEQDMLFPSEGVTARTDPMFPRNNSQGGDIGRSSGIHSKSKTPKQPVRAAPAGTPTSRIGSNKKLNDTDRKRISIDASVGGKSTTPRLKK